MISKTLEDTKSFALEVIRRIFDTKESVSNKAYIVALIGDLGAGKTALVKEIGKELGIADNMVSPTYVIQKKYEIGAKFTSHAQQSTRFTHLIHIDAYRIESADELQVVGWGELVQNSKNLIFIEWPEKAGDLIRPDLTIKCQFVDESTRIYTIEDERQK